MSTLIDQLRGALSRLPRREAAVATAVLADPASVLHCPLSTLAEKAGVSQPTVIRLCRSMGCTGYTDFKLRLAQSLAPGTPFVSAFVVEGDDAARYTAKTFDAAIGALQAARNGLDIRALEAAVGLLADAGRILVFGLGGSAPTAADVQHKLSRFPAPCIALTDPIVARMQLAAMTSNDVLLTISNTGRTRLHLELAELARQAGIPVVSITAPCSPLARLSTVTLGIEPVEDAEIYTPMASRIAHLVVVDVLSTGVALRHGPELQSRLARIKESLRASRLPSSEA